jgi:endo-1,3(4)-beta-glucanase
MKVELPHISRQNQHRYTPINDLEESPNDICQDSGNTPAKQDSKSSNIRNYAFAIFVAGLIMLFVSLIGYQRSLDLGQSTLSKSMPYKAGSHSEAPSLLWGTVSKPYPTGAFWTNLVVKNGDGPIATYPYGIKALDLGLQVSYGAFRRAVSPDSIFDIFMYDLQLSAAQNYISRAVESYDNVSVTLTYKTGNNGKYKAFLVKSSPFVTVYYENATPVISAGLMKIISVDAKVMKDSPGTQYLVTLGNYEKWLVYCSETIIFTWKDNILTAPGPIRGIVRVAVLPIQNFDAAFNLLVSYAPRYPTGGAMTISYPMAGQAAVTITYSTVGAGSLLMLALPHQVPLLPSSLVDSTESKKAQSVLSPLWCIKGKLTAVVGDTFKLTYNLVNVGWYYTLQDKLSNAQLDEIAKYLFYETKIPTTAAQDIYAFGKQVGRMSRLALIADNLGIAEARQQALSNLEQWIIPWLQGMNSEPLVYDKVYGGLVSAQGLTDMVADFGAGWYNDHHFQFGYFVNAIAVMAKLDLPFYEANKAALDTFVRDICNPDASDPDFPFVRHKDFFDGHSWASGIFQQGNGKGQESSSEAINAYYGSYLFACAVGNSELQRLSQLLMTMEIQATQTYWHMKNDDLYDSVFASMKMVGNIGALDVTASTWFGNDVEFVHGINMMPLSPVTAALFDLSYVQQQFLVLANRVKSVPVLVPHCSANQQCKVQGLEGECCPTTDGIMLGCCTVGSSIMDEWRGFTLADLAILDKDAAWDRILALPSFGAGNSRANTLFWAASRPPPQSDFNLSALLISNSSAHRDFSMKSSCALNSACDALGLSGECCPGENGMNLGCCAKVTP